MNKNSVAYITNNIAPFRIDLLDQIARNGFDTTLYYFNELDKGVNPKYVDKRPQIANYENISKKSIFKKINILKKSDILIFDGYSGKNKIIMMLAMICIRKKYYISIDGIVNDKNKYCFRSLLKKILFSNAKYIFSTNLYTDKIIKKILKKSNISRHIFTTLNKDDFEFINDIDVLKNSKKYKINTHKKTILFVGKFLKTKGVKELIDSNNPNYNYIFVGGNKEQLMDICEEVPNNIICYEYLKKRSILELMRLSDVFVLPTYSDVWGLVIIEALSCGIPIVTTNKCNAGVEFIKNGINGYIVSTKNSVELKEKINFAVKLDKYKVQIYDQELMKDYNLENSAKDIIKKIEE